MLKQLTTPSNMLLIAALVIAVIVARPFLLTILTAITLAYIFYPLYRRIAYRLNPSISAAITIAIVIVAFAIPAAFALNALSREILESAVLLFQFFAKHDIAFIETPYVSESLQKLAQSAVGTISNAFAAIPNALIHGFVIIFLVYYLLKDGKRQALRLMKLLPFEKEKQERLTERLSKVTHAVVYGNIIVAIVQGVLAGIGYFIFGIDSPLVWAAITAIMCIVPFLGSYVVWLPLSIVYGVGGYIEDSNTQIIKAVGLAIYSAVIVSSVDNVLKPRIIGRSAKVHPALVLLGALSGLAVFGVVGFVVGPVLLSIAAMLVDMAEEEKGRKHL